MDNKAIAGILYETADLLEIDAADSFRIRSYRNAAEAIEAQPQQISELISDPKRVLAIPGIGKKTAERIVLELKEKLASDDVVPIATPGGEAEAPAHIVARDALVELGYSVIEAEQALAAVDPDLPA